MRHYSKLPFLSFLIFLVIPFLFPNPIFAAISDQAGRTVQVIGPWYDTNGNGIVDPGESRRPTQYAQPTTQYTDYDKSDRVTRTWTNAHPATEYYYEKNGDKTINWVKSPIDATTYLITESHYDKNGRLVLSVVDPTGLNEQTKYIYDTAGRQTEVHAAFETPLETVTYSEYDKANRLIYQRPLVNNNTYATHYEYNKRGQQTL
ncbi:MAG: RHS repeat domain-containing protein, partial [Planctomycetota bacterium]